MSAELAARRTAAAAVLADFRREMDKYIDSNGATPRPDMSTWAWRLSSELGSVLQRLDEDAAEPGPAAQLAEVRDMFARFDSGRDDLQYFIERVEQVVDGGQG